MNWKDYPNTIHSATFSLREWAVIEMALELLGPVAATEPALKGVINSSTLPHVEKILDRGTRHLRKRTKTSGYSNEAAKEASRRLHDDLNWS